MVSLSQFCKNYDLPKTTVYTKGKALGIDFSQGISKHDEMRLLGEFKINPGSSHSSESGTDSVPPSVPTDVPPRSGGSNLSIYVPAPSELDLSRWGINSQDVLPDPIALAKQAIAALDAVDAALDSHVTQLEQRKEKVEIAAKQVSQKRQALETKVLKTELRAEFLGAQINKAEENLRADIASLGKSSAA